MPDSLRHVSIHCAPPGRPDQGATVDLSLPSALTVAELLPWIVDAFAAGDGTSCGWQLTHLGGARLDESTTLAQNDIRDGDLLVLTAAVDRPRPTRPVIAALGADSPGDGEPAGLRIAGGLWACTVGLLALTWTGLHSDGSGRIAAAAVAAVAVTLVAVIAAHLGLDATVVATLDLAAVAAAAAVGFLVVPAGPAPANFFLAAVAAGTLGAVLIRISDCGTEILLAVVTVAAVVAVATAGAVLWPMPAAAVGAVIGASGVGLLALTPRLSIALAGLTPQPPETDPATPDDDPPDAEDRAAGGHRNLVGLVLGCSAAAALGTGVLARSALGHVRAVDVGFAAAVGLALLLRSRTYASGRCRTGPIIGGFCALTAAFVLAVSWAPGPGSWAGIGAVTAGVAVLWPVTVHNPMAARLADAVEYGALAAVAPLACWLAGAFDLVRDLVVR